MIFTFNSQTYNLTLQDGEILDLEKKFNLTNLGYKFRYIGDALYNSFRDKIDSSLQVNDEILDLLIDLKNMPYEEVRRICRDM